MAITAPREHSTDRLYRTFVGDVAEAHLPDGPGDETPVTEADVARLDEPVRRYLRFMGVVGRPRVWSFSARFAGRFRMRPGGPWMPAEAWQYDTSLGIARVFTMRLRVAGVVPMIGHDTYVRGRGRMLGTVVGVVKVADGSGAEFDIGELSTYVNDCVLLAPAMLLGPHTTWTAVDDATFDVALADSGRRVTAHVIIDERGAPVDYSTTDRYAALPGGLVQARWRTPISRWDVVDGRPFPAPGEVTWELDDGPFTYIDGGFVPGSVVVNAPPPS
ncbi:MAG: DUF6544 family protein [Acidimicrobiia bacterium]